MAIFGICRDDARVEPRDGEPAVIAWPDVMARHRKTGDTALLRIARPYCHVLEAADVVSEIIDADRARIAAPSIHRQIEDVVGKAVVSRAVVFIVRLDRARTDYRFGCAGILIAWGVVLESEDRAALVLTLKCERRAPGLVSAQPVERVGDDVGAFGKVKHPHLHAGALDRGANGGSVVAEAVALGAKLGLDVDHAGIGGKAHLRRLVGVTGRRLGKSRPAGLQQ